MKNPEITHKIWQQSFDKQLWYERLNLLDKAKRFCQSCTGRYEFWLAVAVCTLLEPILCSMWPSGWVIFAQIGVLVASTFLYVIQLIGVASREWDKIIMIEAMSSLQSLAIPKEVTNFTFLKLFIFFTAEGEYILEFGCLLGGWIFIFWHPGLAALRCFRPFRLLWFYDVEIFRSRTEYYFNPLFGDEFVSRGFRVLKFAIKALSALGNEMFRLTADTKGGLLLMLIFFYSAYVLGAALWVETNGGNADCDTLGSCMYNLMRLTFFDGTGFDFAYSLTESHKILFCIVMMYMCVTSFGILNGLVGIFGTAFANAADQAFQSEEAHQENAAFQQELKEHIAAANDDMGTKYEDHGEEGDRDGGVEGVVDFDVQSDHSGEGDEEVQMFTDADVSNRPRTAKSIAGDTSEKRRQLAQLVMGAGVSDFARKELSKPTSRQGGRRVAPQEIGQKPARIWRNNAVSAESGLGSSNGLPHHPHGASSANMLGASYYAAAYNELNQRPPTQDRNKQRPGGGMFGGQFGGRTNLRKTSHGSSNSALYGANAHASPQLVSMAAQMLSMQTKIDRQGEAIDGLLDHIRHLSSLLHALHPELALGASSTAAVKTMKTEETIAQKPKGGERMSMDSIDGGVPLSPRDWQSRRGSESSGSPEANPVAAAVINKIRSGMVSAGANEFSSVADHGQVGSKLPAVTEDNNWSIVREFSPSDLKGSDR